MPTYQYACTECGHQLEAVQSFSDPALTECPNCAGMLRKRYNSVGIVFKGSGFYRNDSRSSATGDKANGGGGESAAKSAESSTTSSDSSSSSTSSSSTAASSSGTAKPSGSGATKAAAAP